MAIHSISKSKLGPLSVRRGSVNPAADSAGADSHEVAVMLQRMRTVAKFMDSAYRIPGTNFRFGWDAILGLVPGAGDLATGIVSASIIGYAMRIGVRKRTLARMLGNLGLDLTVGAVPLVGDLFDASYKANLRNVALLEAEIAKRATSRSK